jgi:endonuclease/exonuclease/phosphatase family metal-dependent hydrolase
MRILSYNILDGGTGRTAALFSVIERQKPDVVGLVEAEDRAVVEDLAGRLGMDFVQGPGNHKASALLSRFVIRDSINHAPLHKELTKSLLEATVVDPKGVEWTMGVLHLHAQALEADEAVREREIGKVLELFAGHREAGRAHLIMGDFNANAPGQKIDPALCKPSTREAWEKNGGRIPRRVVGRILEERYLDSMAVVDPEWAFTSGTFSTQFPGQRVDYVFAYGIEPGRIRKGEIIYDGEAHEASDHFPIAVEVD